MSKVTRSSRLIPLISLTVIDTSTMISPSQGVQPIE
nr:MAG TPA: hypothetical protein [Caudoviricetes sp.]